MKRDTIRHGFDIGGSGPLEPIDWPQQEQCAICDAVMPPDCSPVCQRCADTDRALRVHEAWMRRMFPQLVK